ncbi:MAG TPA: tetratricopeptide repeat protein [Bacteroidia bacterium]|nr:tetratricopeptide repeat protein [Bacteroidia bacterium]HNT79515.1 tetratricopeptide repeat protein [Bacteroidia bacterium]
MPDQKYKNGNWVCLLLLMILLSPVVVLAQKKKSDQNKNNSELTEEQSINLEYNFFNAHRERINGNLEKALDLFGQCLRIDPKNAASMYEIARIYIIQRKSNDALFFAKSAAQINPDNEWYQLLLADLYESMGQYDKASEVYAYLVKRFPEQEKYVYDLAAMQLFQGKFEQALKTYDELEKRYGVNREIIIQKQNIYLRLNKTDKAAAEIERWIATDPNDVEGYLMLIDLYNSSGNQDELFKTVERVKQIDPENPRLSLALAEYYRSKDQKEESFRNLKIAFESTRLEAEIKVKVLSSYLSLVQESQEMLDQALTLSEIFARVDAAEPSAHAIYGDFLSIANKLELAREEYRKAISIDNKTLSVWQQLLIIESELSDFSAMADESNQAIELFPSQPILYLFNGIAHSRLEQCDKAIKSLLSGSKMVVDNDALLVDFYSNLGDCYNTTKNYEESDKYFDKALKIRPDNEYILNNYAYYLSLRNDQLDKAAQMSKKSNEIRTNSSSFEDTYAWILYKMGKYQEAKIWIEKAMTNGGDQSDVITEHYGDILYQLGEQGKAYEMWLKAKSMGNGSDLLSKKIADKKLHE